MIQEFLESKIAIVGAGRFCKSFLRFIYDEGLACRCPEILGVADKNEDAPGFRFAKELGIFTTKDFTELYRLDGLQVILELTSDRSLGKIIRQSKPPSVKVIDHFEARAVWDFLQLEDLKQSTFKELETLRENPAAAVNLFKQSIDHFSALLWHRNQRAHEIEMELVEQEQTQAQIIQGSTIPTFVVNKEHLVTHWNKAMERFSNISNEDIVGTNKQWVPFYEKERPTMADVILDQYGEEEIRKLYGSKWHRSALIEDAYESEGFFPRLGKNGKWCWFTAAPIKGPDGTIVAAIETFWDTTEDKKAEEERDRHTRELAALCSIYTSLSAPLSLNDRINAALKEIKSFLSAEHICIFLSLHDDIFHVKYNYGQSGNSCRKNILTHEETIIRDVVGKNAPLIFENLDKTDGIDPASSEDKLKSLAYIPISAKEQKTFGVIRIACKRHACFPSQERNVLELIGNRIGVAIENAMLQEQYIKSEEKYRTLFNNDPNPIFILDSDTLKVLDINQRAQDCYGYPRTELFGFPFLKLGDREDFEVKTGLRNLIEGQSILFSKKRHYKKGGISFFVNINVSRSRYGERDVLIATTTDITESVQKETQLIQAGKMATLGLMAAGMAHEINQPLNVIQICSDFLVKMVKKGAIIRDEDILNTTRDIIENVKRATKVIQHVRSFARQSEIVRNRVNINNPIWDVFKILGNQINVHQVRVELKLAQDLPDIMAEHNRLEQVFINLVSNAIDAMDEKTEHPDYKDAEKRLTIESYAENGLVVVNVSDTGVGMTEEVMNKILEPFFTTKKVGKGTGLGVSISYGIVKDYDGTIDIDSKVGVGTTFRLKFPAMDKGRELEENKLPQVVGLA
jgi:PAS domain S-box-containing protein